MFISFLKNIYSKASAKSAVFSPYKPAIFITSHRNIVSAEADSENQSAVNISQSCVERLKKIASDGVFLRVAIDGGGCSGFQYRFDLDSVLKEDDVCFTRDGAQIVVDKISLDFLKGATIEFEEKLIRSSFLVINNPQAESKCSCGTSFAVKMS